MTNEIYISKIKQFMPLMNSAFEPGKAKDYINSISDENLKKLAMAEYYYFSGDHDKANISSNKLLKSDNPYILLSALLINTFANLTLNNSEKAMKNIELLSNLKKQFESADTSSQPNDYESYVINVVINSCSILLHNSNSESFALRDYIKYLPEGLKIYAYYLWAHSLYQLGEYGKSLGIAETALSMTADNYPIPLIYLRLVAAMSSMAQKQLDNALEHFNMALELAKLDNLLEPFAEHHGLLYGLVEVVLKKNDPKWYKEIINITYSFSYGWRRAHSKLTNNTIADDLSTTEFTVAMLANKNWNNKEIATYLEITQNTVKTYLARIYQKLEIKNRKQLQKYMLK